MKQLRKTAAAAVLGGAVMLTTSAFSATVTLNPSATNGGAGQLSSTNAAFQTDKATTNFASLLQISSAPGALGSIPYSETGFLLVESFSGHPNSVTGVTEKYNVYALFTLSGTGSWMPGGSPATGGVFAPSTTSVSLTATLYGSPGAAPVGVATPTLGNLYGIIPDASDFVLGPATFAAGTFASGIANLAANHDAFTSFSAKMNFTPAANTEGPGGFWEAPVPFDIDLSASATGTIPPGPGEAGTTWSTSGGMTYVTTSVTPLNKGSGSGNVLFANRVPEPGVLALAGLALLGAGAASRRRKLTAA